MKTENKGKKRVVIIGGGIGGLACGIKAARAGFEVEVYEKNPVTGGVCSGWKRGKNNEYTIDNCLHWLTGWLPSMPENKFWKDYGVIRDDEPPIIQPYFFSSEHKGQRITLWHDVNRLEKEMLELSPEDKKEIRRFIALIKFSDVLMHNADKKDAFLIALKKTSKYMNPLELAHTALIYLRSDQGQIAARFKHPLFGKLFYDFISEKYESYWLTFAYGIYACGNGELPQGGSRQIPIRIEETCKKAGAKVFVDSPVAEIVFDSKNKKKATGIRLEDGTFVPADYVVCACDINYTFSKFLPKKNAPGVIRHDWLKNKRYPFFSTYQCAFAVDGLFDCIEVNMSIDCRPMKVMNVDYDRFNIRNYKNYGDFIAPKGQTVIQVTCPQYEKDYLDWKELKKNPDAYNAKKVETANAIMERIEDRFPEYKGKLTLLDSWTPVTYAERVNGYYGAYMRFITKVTGKYAFIKPKVRGMKNVWISGQWIRYPGGMPEAVNAATSTMKSLFKVAGVKAKAD